MARRQIWAGSIAFMLVPWALIGQSIFAANRPWRGETDAATLLLLVLLPLLGTVISAGWALFGLHRCGIKHRWLWGLPVVGALAFGQFALAWWFFWTEVAPT